jgi:hypothetical protein
MRISEKALGLVHELDICGYFGLRSYTEPIAPQMDLFERGACPEGRNR